MYRAGDGVRQSDLEALRWYRKAADQGHPKAQFGLGLMYFHGLGVGPDFREAARWYRKAIERKEAHLEEHA
jgi:TPR repeat protein